MEVSQHQPPAKEEAAEEASNAVSLFSSGSLLQISSPEVTSLLQISQADWQGDTARSPCCLVCDLTAADWLPKRTCTGKPPWGHALDGRENISTEALGGF